MSWCAVKKELNSWIIAIVAFFVMLASLAIFLMVESYFFVRHTQELVRLKEDYANYTLALKQMIAGHEEINVDEEQDSSSLKKKKIATEDEFVVINRDFDYLRSSAIKYARKHRLEGAISLIYQRGVRWIHLTDQKRPLPIRRRLRRKEQRHILTIDPAIQQIAQEHQFICPLARGSFRYTSRFGPRRRANGTWGFHFGLDMAAPRGTPVKAVAHGVIIEARYAKGYGNTVLISHSPRLKTRYAHLSKIDVRVGDLVEQGQRIGRVGNTGHTRGKNGMHLHVEVLVYGKQTNPGYFFS